MEILTFAQLLLEIRITPPLSVKVQTVSQNQSATNTGSDANRSFGNSSHVNLVNFGPVFKGYKLKRHIDPRREEGRRVFHSQQEQTA